MNVTQTEDFILPESPPTILVVDDNVDFLELCTRTLSVIGYTVHQARNGTKALEQARQQDYDIILLDLRMPDLDGISCLHRLRANGCRAAVIMVTGMGDVQTVVEAMNAGASDFVKKPCRSAELVAKIEALLKKRSLQLATDSAEEAERRQKERRGGEDRRRDERRTQSADPIVAYIREHATEIYSRRDVAESMQITVEAVSARVQQVTGLFFRQFLHDCRVKEAKELLETTDLAIGQIAAQVGFATVQHFSRVFSSIAGISARKHRQQNRTNS